MIRLQNYTAACAGKAGGGTIQERKMKTKIVLLILVLTGIVLFGCKSSPSNSNSGQITPSFDGFTPGTYSTLNDLDYQSNNHLIQYNRDGSITMFTYGNVQFRIMPMTASRSSRGALDRTPQEFDTLIKQYEAALAANPQDYDAYIRLAGLYIDRGNPGDADMAIRYSEQALTIRKDDADALYARGIAYNEKGDASSRAMALSDLEVVLQSSLQSMKGVYYVMGMIYYKDNKVDEAIEAFEKVKTLDPEFVDTDEILSVLYSRK
jgi:tetratricopeptide (TPR) repeat protein